MQKFLSLFLPAALVLGVYAGGASAEQLRNWVKSVDTDSQSLRLKNGIVFRYADDIDVSDLQPGTKIKVFYKRQKNQNVVNNIRILSQPE